MSDTNERSVASAGSVANRSFENWYRSLELESFKPELRAAWDAGQASLGITDAEREAIKAAARIIDAYEEEMDGFQSGAAARLRKLLERLG